MRRRRATCLISPARATQRTTRTAYGVTPQRKSFAASTAEARLRQLAVGKPGGIATRLDELDREWDTDRMIEVEAAFMGLFGLALGALADRRLLALPAMVGVAVFLHATTGWYPLLPVFRRLGFRSAREIARERYALKALRGDFHLMNESGAAFASSIRRGDESVRGVQGA
jgi:hypothetical protein